MVTSEGSGRTIDITKKKCKGTTFAFSSSPSEEVSEDLQVASLFSTPCETWTLKGVRYKNRDLEPLSPYAVDQAIEENSAHAHYFVDVYNNKGRGSS